MTKITVAPELQDTKGDVVAARIAVPILFSMIFGIVEFARLGRSQDYYLYTYAPVLGGVAASVGLFTYYFLVSVERTLVCDICQNETSAPVSGDWAFRLNDFVLEAYRDHGIEPVVWSLWRLSVRARTSFYFAPSMSLWDDYPENVDGPIAELDALAVVDGMLYLIEAKASARLSADQIKSLVDICERVRPDVLLIALMEAKPSAGLDRRLDGLKLRLMPRTKVEILRFERSDLEDGSMLPH
jgi:hypothetical protein